MEKVLIVVHDFPGNGGLRFVKFVQHLPRLGYEPLVLTVRAKPTGADVTSSPRGTKVFRTVCLRKSPFRVFSKIFNAWSVTTYFESLFFIPDLFITWAPSAILKGYRLIRKEGITIVVTTSPPESVHVIGLLLKRFTGVKWIADFQDLWTTKRTVYRPPTPLHDLLVKRLEKTVYAKSDHIIANTCGNDRFYQELFGISRDKITVIPNGYDGEEQGSLRKHAADEDRKEFSIGYMGYFDKNGFPWKEFLGAFRKIIESAKGAVIRLHVAGHMSEEATRYVERQGLRSHIIHYGTLPHHDAFQLIARCDLLLLLMYETPYSRAIVPHKLYYYLAMSKPIIAIAEEGGEVSQIIKKANAGQTFPVERIGEATRAILDALHERSAVGHIEHLPDPTAIGAYEYGTLTQTLARTMDAVLVRKAQIQASDMKDSSPRRSPPEHLLTTPETK